MATNYLDIPLIVRAGILTAEEWAEVPPELQQDLEAETADYIRRYGEDWLRKDRERHRADLSLAYGIC
jgi:hypothetical protein